MKVKVTKFLNDKKIATASRVIESAAQLQAFLGNMGLKKSNEDAEFDFTIFTERDYVVETYTEDYEHDLH